MKGGTVRSYSGTAVETETVPGKPSQKTLPQLWLHLPHAPQPLKPTSYFQFLEPVTALSPRCACTNCLPLLNYSPRLAHFHLSLTFALTVISLEKLSLKPARRSDYKLPRADIVPWTRSRGRTWAPALHTWGAVSAPTPVSSLGRVSRSCPSLSPQHLWQITGLCPAGMSHVISQSRLRFKKNCLP